MKKYNLSEIMKKAWKRYHDVRNSFYANESQKLWAIKENTFSYCLKLAWREVKDAMALAAKMAEFIAKGEFRHNDEFFVDMSTNIIGGRATYHYRNDFKRCGFKWQYVGGSAYTYSSNGFAWVGNAETTQKLIKMYA